MKTIFALIIGLISLKVIGQTHVTNNPYVGFSNCRDLKISRVEVSKLSTKIYFVMTLSKQSIETFNFSGIVVMSDFSNKELEVIREVDYRFKLPPYPIGAQNPNTYDLWKEVVLKTQQEYLATRDMLNSIVVQSFSGIEPFKEYKTKTKINTVEPIVFSLTFNGLPPGVKTISLMDLAENGIEFTGISINNPDNLENTGLNKENLMEKWEITKPEKFEGFYEVVAADENQTQFEFALVQSDVCPYSMIYLGGISKNGWKKGSVKAYLKNTSSPHIFQCDYYTFDKTMTSALLSFNSAGLTIDLGDGNIVKCLKTFPLSEVGTYTYPESNEQSSIISTGTGFAISKNGYIATNYHVIEGARDIAVRGIAGSFTSTYSAEVVASDKNNDIAIIRLKDNKVNLGNIPYQIFHTQLDVASQVFALGYPLIASMGDEIKYTNGVISSKSGFQGDLTMYQTSVPVQPGNSGGPLVGGKGNIVGVITAKHNQAENASYAVKSGYLLSLIDNLEPKAQLPANNLLINKPVTEQIKAIKNFVYIIEIR
jgi:S1-C subfamily serine protease